MKKFNAILFFLILPALLLGQNNQNLVGTGRPSEGGQVKLTYSNDPPSELSKQRFEQLMEMRRTGGTKEIPDLPVNPNFQIPGPTQAETPAPPMADQNAFLAPEDYQTYKTNTIDVGASSGLKSVVSEPSVGAAGNVIMTTGNWWASISFDHGTSWKLIDPFTQFPASDGGFCCDQEVIYDEEREMMIWLLQYSRNTLAGGNRYRVAYSVGIDNIMAGNWGYWDYTPAFVGAPNPQWFDYPHMVLSDDQLFITNNLHSVVGAQLPWQSSGFLSVNLDDLASGAAPNTSFWYQSGLFNFTPVQGSTSTLYWAAHIDNANLRVYNWTPGGSITWNDVPHTPFTQVPGNPRAGLCPSSDGGDACARVQTKILSAWRGNGRLGFGWTVPQGNGFTFPYSRFVRLNESDRSLIDEPVISNGSFAWIYPAVGVNDRGHLGGTLHYSGGTFFPSIATFLADDISDDNIVLYQTIDVSTAGPFCNRFGDYYRSRPYRPWGNTFIATGQTLEGGNGGSNCRGTEVTPRVIWFGRVRDRAPDSFSLSSLWASLDGPFVSGGSSTSLLTPHIPFAQPFCTSPWNYCGGESFVFGPANDVVDWGLLRIYAGHPNDKDNMVLMGQKAVVFKEDGRVQNTLYSNSISFSGLRRGHYWVALYHRNHLGVIQAGSEDFTNGSGSHSFRFDGSYGFNSQRQVGSHSIMWGGDGSANGSITSFDFTNHWLPQNGGAAGYWSGDFDMNASVTAFDFLNVWLPANGLSSFAPDP